MEERQEHRQRMLPAHDQASEIAEPGESAFDFPALAVASQLASVLGGRPLPVLAMRGDQLDPTLLQTAAQGITVVGL